MFEDRGLLDDRGVLEDRGMLDDCGVLENCGVLEDCEVLEDREVLEDCSGIRLSVVKELASELFSGAERSVEAVCDTNSLELPAELPLEFVELSLVVEISGGANTEPLSSFLALQAVSENIIKTVNNNV